MKKFLVLPLIILVALASCKKNNDSKPEPPISTTARTVNLQTVVGGTVKMYCKGAEIKPGDTVTVNSYVTVEAVADNEHVFSGINIYKGVAVRDSFKVTKDTTIVAEFTEVDVLPATDKYKVCNYNIRLYTDSDKKDKHWTNRRSYLFSMIQKHTMDVCGLEEMTPQQAPDFEKNMPDYEYVGYGRDNGKAYGAGSSGEQTGLVYNKRHFVKQDQGRFFLSNTPNKPSKVSGASFNRMVTWVKLKERKSDVIFYFFATHFDHPTNQTGINTRSKEADIALVEVPKIVGDNPMFFVGDFNCRPEEPAYQKLAAKWKDSFITMGDEAQGGYVCNEAQLARTGLQADCACKGNTYTGLYNAEDSLPKRIDFVLYNEVHAYPVSYIADGDNMGHTTLPSDHVPVVTEMMLK